jgi:hypothetical protein
MRPTSMPAWMNARAASPYQAMPKYTPPTGPQFTVPTGLLGPQQGTQAGLGGSGPGGLDMAQLTGLLGDVHGWMNADTPAQGVAGLPQMPVGSPMDPMSAQLQAQQSMMGVPGLQGVGGGQAAQPNQSNMFLGWLNNWMGR